MSQCGPIRPQMFPNDQNYMFLTVWKKNSFVLWGYSQSFKCGVTWQLLERKSAPYFIRQRAKAPIYPSGPILDDKWAQGCPLQIDEKLCETDYSGRVPWNLVSSRNCFLILNPGLVHLLVKVSLGTRMAWGIHKAIGWSGSSGGPSTPSLPVKVVLTRRRAACLHCFHCVTFLDDLLLTEARGHYKAQFNWGALPRRLVEVMSRD